MKLHGRNVWLIGASTGIGAALAPELAARGARLALSARNEDALRVVASRCKNSAADPIVLPLDVTEDGAIDRAAARLRAEWGSIDVLVYNAGTWAPVDIERFDVAAIEQQFEVNLTGMVRAVGAVLPQMIERRFGDIVGVASLSAYGAFPRAEAYGASKAAANYFLQSLRLDAKPYGIGVVTVNPGFVKTQLTRENDFPMPFIMEPEDAAKAIVRGLLAGKTEIHFPLRLSMPLKLLTALPRPLYEFLAGRVLKS